jgi:hypothetical protein
MSSNITGSGNTAIGNNAGRYILGGTTALTVSTNSIFLGASSRANADNETNQIVIGTSITGLGSNTTVIGNSSTTFGRWFGNLLVGNSTNSGQMLQVTGTAKITDTLTIGATDNSFIYESGGSLILQTGASADLIIPSSGASIFNFGLNVLGDLTLSNANPFLYGGTADGSLGLSNIGGQSYIRVFGASHSTTPNVTQFVNAGSTSLTIASTGAATFSSSVTATQGIFRNSGVPAIQVIRDLNVVSVGPAGQGIEFGALNGTTPTAGAAIYGVLENPATTGSLIFQTLTSGSLSTKLTLASTGAATFSGSVSTPNTTKTANYTLTATDYTVGFDCASNRTATLPDATTCAGRIYVIYQYNTNLGARSVTLDGNGSQTINGVTTYNLLGYCDYSSVMIQSNGSNWIIIANALETCPV